MDKIDDEQRNGDLVRLTKDRDHYRDEAWLWKRFFIALSVVIPVLFGFHAAEVSNLKSDLSRDRRELCADELAACYGAAEKASDLAERAIKGEKKVMCACGRALSITMEKHMGCDEEP